MFYSRRVFDGFQCLIWLLCDESRWMPEELRETLKQGFRERTAWWIKEVFNSTDTGWATIHDQTISKLSYTRTLKAELTGSCVKALEAWASRKMWTMWYRSSSRGDSWRDTTKSEREFATHEEGQDNGVAGLAVLSLC